MDEKKSNGLRKRYYSSDDDEPAQSGTMAPRRASDKITGTTRTAAIPSLATASSELSPARVRRRAPRGGRLGMQASSETRADYQQRVREMLENHRANLNPGPIPEGEDVAITSASSSGSTEPEKKDSEEEENAAEAERLSREQANWRMRTGVNLDFWDPDDASGSVIPGGRSLPTGFAGLDGQGLGFVGPSVPLPRPTGGIGLGGQEFGGLGPSVPPPPTRTPPPPPPARASPSPPPATATTTADPSEGSSENAGLRRSQRLRRRGLLGGRDPRRAHEEQTQRRRELRRSQRTAEGLDPEEPEGGGFQGDFQGNAQDEDDGDDEAEDESGEEAIAEAPVRMFEPAVIFPPPPRRTHTIAVDGRVVAIDEELRIRAGLPHPMHGPVDPTTRTGMVVHFLPHNVRIPTLIARSPPPPQRQLPSFDPTVLV